MRRAIQLNRAPLLIAFGLVVALGSAALFKAAHADVITNTKVSFTGFGVPNPCLPPGEMVLFSGELHTLFRLTVDPNGGFHLGIHENTQGLTGEGSLTGAKYRLNSTFDFDQELNIKSLPAESTTTNAVEVIGQGQAPNFILHITIHLTINANGEVTSTVAKIDSECK